MTHPTRLTVCWRPDRGGDPTSSSLWLSAHDAKTPREVCAISSALHLSGDLHDAETGRYVGAVEGGVLEWRDGP